MNKKLNYIALIITFTSIIILAVIVNHQNSLLNQQKELLEIHQELFESAATVFEHQEELNQLFYDELY